MKKIKNGDDDVSSMVLDKAKELAMDLEDEVQQGFIGQEDLDPQTYSS
jgi:hypothetical protein